MLVNTGAYTPLTWFFGALAIAAFVVEAWALIDAVRRPASAFTAADKQTKQLWLIILGVATAIGLFGVTYGISLVSILPVAAFVAAGIYLTDVRPKVSQYKTGSNNGPYGPW